MHAAWLRLGIELDVGAVSKLHKIDSLLRCS